MDSRMVMQVSLLAKKGDMLVAEIENQLSQSSSATVQHIETQVAQHIEHRLQTHGGNLHHTRTHAKCTPHDAT